MNTNEHESGGVEFLIIILLLILIPSVLPQEIKSKITIKIKREGTWA